MRPVYRVGGCVAHTISNGTECRWSRIETELSERGKGWAEQMFRVICQDADAEGITLLISIEPDPGTDHIRLAALSMRHGFTYVTDSSPAMIRYPRKAEPA